MTRVGSQRHSKIKKKYMKQFTNSAFSLNDPDRSKFWREWFDNWISDAWKFNLKSLSVWFIMNFNIYHAFVGTGNIQKCRLRHHVKKFSNLISKLLCSNIISIVLTNPRNLVPKSFKCRENRLKNIYKSVCHVIMDMTVFHSSKISEFLTLNKSMKKKPRISQWTILYVSRLWNIEFTLLRKFWFFKVCASIVLAMHGTMCLKL